LFKWVLFLSEYSQMLFVRQKESRNLTLNLCFPESFLWWYVNTGVNLLDIIYCPVFYLKQSSWDWTLVSILR
jgi:hypothetical protein